MHMVSRKDLDKAELATVRISKKSDDGGNSQRRGASKRIGNGIRPRIRLIRDSDAFRRYTGSSFTRKTLRKSRVYLPLDQWSETTSHSKMARKPIATQRNMYHSLSLVYRQVPLLHLHLRLQDTVTTTEHPATERSEGMSDESQGNLSHGSAETKNPNKNDDDEELHSDQLQGVPDRLQEFRHGLVDQSVLEHRDASSSSHELLLEPRARVVSGKHSIFTHFPRDRNCDICLKTKITRAPCRKRIGTVVPRAEHFGDWITADHKVLSEGSESRNNHRCAVVVQDLTTQWIQSYPWKTKTSQETPKSLQKFLEPTRKPKVICTVNSSEFGKSCEELTWNHCASTPHRSENDGIAGRAVRRSKEGTSAVLLQWGLDEKWWICETFKTSCLMGETVRAERRIIFFSTEAFDVTKNTDTSLDVLLERHVSMTIGTLMEIQDCQMDGQISKDSIY